MATAKNVTPVTDLKNPNVWAVILADDSTFTTTSTTALTVAKVWLPPGFAGTGTIFRITLGGALAGGNSAFTIKINLGTTTLQTSTSDAATAGKWASQSLVRFKSASAQKAISTLLLDTEDPDVQYDAGTVNCRGGLDMSVVVTAGNGSDTVTVEFIMIEMCRKPT